MICSVSLDINHDLTNVQGCVAFALADDGTRTSSSFSTQRKIPGDDEKHQNDPKECPPSALSKNHKKYWLRLLRKFIEGVSISPTLQVPAARSGRGLL